MTCCCSPFYNWLKSWFIANEKEIDKETEIIASKIVSIILPIIKQELENIIDTKFPELKPITDQIVNQVL